VRFRFFAMASAWAPKRGGGERLRPEGSSRRGDASTTVS
jgi:hypothetical protein